jgi:hypothetical protein
MESIDQILSSMPIYTDWQRYDCPTVLRRQGRDFRERNWHAVPTQLERHALTKDELKVLVESYGGLCFCAVDKTVLLFADYHWARRCQRQLLLRGIQSLRLGCYLQLQEPG